MCEERTHDQALVAVLTAECMRLERELEDARDENERLCDVVENLEARVEVLEATAAEKLRLHEWADSDEAGRSSRTIAAVCGGIRLNRVGMAPLDAGDFARCVRVVRAFPVLRARLGMLTAEHDRTWPSIVARWNDLCALHDAQKWDALYTALLEIRGVKRGRALTFRMPDGRPSP